MIRSIDNDKETDGKMKMIKHPRFALLALATTILTGTPSTLAKLPAPDSAPLSDWKNLDYPRAISPGATGAIYYNFALPNGSRAHLIVIDTRSDNWKVKPAVSAATKATSEFATAENASAAINAGFFNLSDGESTSYITINGKPACNPKNNKALTENPKLQPFLDRIFDRHELRFYQDTTGKTHTQIAKHSDTGIPGWQLLHAVQGGPQLLPVLTAEQEAFIRKESDGKEVDSIGCNKTAARTACGITEDGYLLLLTVCGNGQNPESKGITLQQLADLLKQLGCKQALNFDGGSSSTMFVRLRPVNAEPSHTLDAGTTVCGKSPETRVKSTIILVPAVQANGH